MTLQQLKYIIAIHRHRNFAKAAEELHVTQPTLSSMLVKLEEELDVRIFDRSNKRVVPTDAGEKIVAQAQRTLREAERIEELVAEYKGEASGKFMVAVGPTIAPYILPQFIHNYTDKYPQVELNIVELKAEAMIEGLIQGSLDAGIAISGNQQAGILEIPLYTENFWVYLSEQCWRKLPMFRPENLEHEQMWIMKEAQCLRESAFSFCKARSVGKRIYEAGSIETLIRIVDLNGGFTIIPEMHLPFLQENQRKNVRRIEGNHRSLRRISLYIKEDYVREQLLNTLTDTLCSFMPSGMMEEHLVKFGVKL
ncbi:LysR family transcriptional regulator [gut metagenome]|uniref:LysR family transcriptional regulator n=1 Tax=gut metagenome TaxID=749906 RepID=J9GQZ2_9ZZZZ